MNNVLREFTIVLGIQKGLTWVNITVACVTTYLQKCKMHQFCNIQYKISFPHFLKFEEK